MWLGKGGCWLPEAADVVCFPVLTPEIPLAS